MRVKVYKMKRLVLMGCVLMLSLNSCSDSTIDSDSNDTPRWIIRVPSQQPTLQAALNIALVGDTILVAAGIYRGDGNRDISMPNKSFTILSEDGPSATVFDCEGTAQENHYHMSFVSHSEKIVIDGFTFRGAYASHGAIRCRSASPEFVNCIFRNNEATTSGGAMHCKGASPLLRNCTLVDNSSMAGAGLFLIAGSRPRLENCLISHSGRGEAILASEGTSEPSLSCCNLFGNAGGDWIDHIEEQALVNGNISADPLFCDRDDIDLRLQPDSPCAPDNNDCGELIGAVQVGCL